MIIGIRSLKILLASLFLTVTAAEAAESGRERSVTVMTRNVYPGVDAETAAVPTATSFPDLLQKVAAVYQGYFTRNFPQRAAARSRDRSEAARSDRPPRGDPGAHPIAAGWTGDTGYDGRARLRANSSERFVRPRTSLRGRRTIKIDPELPSALGIDVRQTDRNVILARLD